MKNNNVISIVLFALLFTFAQNVQSQNSNVSVRPISELLDSLYLAEKYPELLKVVDNVINIKKSKNDIYSLDYTEMLMKKASSLYRQEKPGAADVCKEATLIVSKLIGKYNETYKDYVKSLATYCYAEDIYPDCIIYENEALDIESKLNIPLDFERLSIMCEGKSDRELGVSNIHLLGRSTFDIFGSIIQGQNKEYNNLVTANKNYENSKRTTGEKGLEFAKAEENLALASIAVGDTAIAQDLIFSATSRRYNTLGEDNIDFLRSALLHADILAVEGQTLLALDQGKYVASKLKELKLDNTSTYIDALILVGVQYAHMGVNGEPQIQEALDVSKKVFGVNSPEYDRSRFAYAQILYKNMHSSNDIDGETLNTIIGLANDTYIWRKKNLGVQHRDCIMSLLALATFYEDNKQFAKSNELFDVFVKSQSSIVKDNFVGMSYGQQRNYWYKFNYYYQTSIPRVLWNESLNVGSKINASVCYDATLFSKGILLKSFTARHESELQGNDESYNNFIKNLSLTWKDVKNSLKKDEVAIEFVSFKNDKLRIIRTATTQNDKIKVVERPVGIIPQSIYGAMVLTNELPNPIFIPLCDLNSAGNIEINGHIQSEMLHNLIWKPIQPYLSKASCIYFSPSEDFYNIPLESLVSSDDKKPMSEKYKMIRLSSTGLLALNEKSSGGKDAAIYGGINFDITLDEMKNDRVNYQIVSPQDRNEVSLLRGKRESSDEIEYLPGTLEEAQNIVKFFTPNNKIGQAKLITGKKATETSLKALSGSKIKVMHIGTHGFYEVESEDQGTITFDSDIKFSEEDKALLRSGLLFAGAQNFFDGTELPDDVEDGILTSHEISYLDFYGLDLITLSACQTAQGDVTSDGIFGLQRGFKKAGAKSILMSLWKVDDNATNKLMTEFYSNWLSKNMSKYDALEAAKRTVRNTKGWEDPKYWAAFILLDGLN